MATSRVVTIDGPAGAGKSTVASRLANQLGWRLLDTGAMYRAVTLAGLRQQVDLQSEAAIGELAGRITVRLEDGRIWLDDEDVSSAIRGAEVTRATRYSADSPSVRRHLVAWQRAFADQAGNIVTEGRDQGTIVFPDAFRKYYLTASNEERARRRHAEFLSRGESIPIEAVLRDILDRDAQDTSRTIAPMKAADDAVIIDSSTRTLDQVVDQIVQEIRQHDR